MSVPVPDQSSRIMGAADKAADTDYSDETLTRIDSNLNCRKCCTYIQSLIVVFEINRSATRPGENQHKKYSGRILLPDLC